MAEQIYDKMGDNPNQTLLNKEVGDAWDSVDNRLGELVYDNLFWNRTAKDVALVAFRSTGWNLGTAREIGGGALDVGRTIRGRISGDKTPLLSHRTAYTMALLGSVMTMGATMTYMATGKGPQESVDYLYPPDGTTGPDGKPNRQYLKTYLHDTNSLIHDPVSTITHKASPLLSMAYDLIKSNSDYYGREIRHPGDSPLDQMKSVGKYIAQSSMPFIYQNYKENERRDTSKMAQYSSVLGILPAPKWAGQSKAEALAYDLAMRSMPSTQDTDTFDRNQRVEALRNKYSHGNASLGDVLKAADTGNIRYQDVKTIAEEAEMSPLQRHVSRLNPKDAMQVYNVATPDEQKSLNLMMWKKFESVYKDYSPEEIKPLEKQFTDALLPKQQGDIFDRITSNP